MTKERLFNSAAGLVLPSRQAASEFEQQRVRLSEELIRRMEARPDLDQLIGAGNRAMMENNSRNFCRFMSTLFVAYEPFVLVETALWVFRTYRSYGFHAAYWPAHLDLFAELIREELSTETFAEVYPFFHWLIIHIPAFILLTDEPLLNPTEETTR